MLPRKIQMDLIAKAQDRAATFNRRKKGLKKMAYKLSVLCDIDVAVVFAGPGGGAPDVWESGAGVIDRYRRLPADKRAKHTHLNYLDVELGKVNVALAKERRMGPKALASPGAALLEGMKLEELLGSIDAALLATAQRREALGMPADGAAVGGQLRQAASDAAVPLAPVGADDIDDMEAWFDELMWHGAEHHPLNASMTQPAAGVQYIAGVEPHPLNASIMQPAAGVQHVDQHQPQMPPGNGVNGHGQFPWNGYQPNNAISDLDYGFRRADNSYFDMDGCLQMPMPAPSNANAYHGCLSVATFSANESSYHAVVPVEYHPSMDIAGNAVCMPPERHSTMSTGDNFAGVSAIGLEDSFMDAEYETQCLADYFQSPDARQNFGFEPLHYLSDMDEGIRYHDLDEAGSCSHGRRTELFAQSHGSSGALQFSSEQSQSDVPCQDSGVQQFWVMEGAGGFN